MKRISTIVMALLMVLTMSQCKKNEETNQGETVTITLDVKGNNGAKVVVNPATGTVDFESGDKVYVGSGGKYVGFLTHNGTNFVGNITNPTEGQPLQFYFLGNVTPDETLSAGTTESCSVIISDQTEQLPVISCAASNENYVSGVTAYSAHLLNKCALVKFNVTTPSNSPICITGMKNKVTVDFGQNTVTPSMDGEGIIKLPAGSGENVEKWAILLPQEALEEGEEGSAYSEDGTCSGIRPAFSLIAENGYMAEGIPFIVNNASVPVGAINGLFTINANGDKVYFSKGNLLYKASSRTWRFAEHQYDFVGGFNNGGFNPDYQQYGNVYEGEEQCQNNLIASNYSGWIDLFGWGTSGYHYLNDQYNVNYQPWSSSTSDVNYNYNYWGYGPSTNMPSPNLTGNSANYDWGVYNPISNGGNTINQWRTLTLSEWRYVINTRITISGVRFAKAQVNYVNGVILLPDNWDNNIYNLCEPNNGNASFSSNILTISQWSILEQVGVVFLPATGGRIGTSIIYNGLSGRYWSATHIDNSCANIMCFEDNYISTDQYYSDRSTGTAVRLVQNAE